MATETAVQKTPEREAFYKKIDGENLSALWNVMGDLITPEPKSACRPHLWKFDAIRDYMTEAGKLIGLRDDRLVTRKTTFEQKIRRAEADAKLGADAAKVWDQVAASYKKWTPFEKPYEILEAAPAPGSRLFQIARQIVRHETVDASTEPINDKIEALMLTQ